MDTQVGSGGFYRKRDVEQRAQRRAGADGAHMTEEWNHCKDRLSMRVKFLPRLRRSTDGRGSAGQVPTVYGTS